MEEEYILNFWDGFWSKVNKDGPIHPVVGQCWLWTGYSTNGYGVYRGMGAHRVAYRLAYGKLADNKNCVCHKCDNPICVRPDHLFNSTHLGNSLDRDMKLRTKGTTRPLASIPDDELRVIKEELTYWKLKKWVRRKHNLSAESIRQLCSELGLP